MSNKKITEQENIEILRQTIDEIDGLIKTLLEKRYDAVKLIGVNKKQAGIAVLDKSREEKVLEKVSDSKYPEQIKEVYRKIMEQAKTLE